MEIKTQVINIKIETLETAAARELQSAYFLYASYHADIVARQTVEYSQTCAAEYLQASMRLRSFLGL